MLNRLYEPMFLSQSYAPPKLCKLPLKIFSPLLTRMAEEARIGRTLNLKYGLQISPRSEKIMP